VLSLVHMAQPRPVEPNKTYLVTRRCSQRQFLLLPSPVINCILLFCFAMAAFLTGVRIHAICVLGNHIHAVVTDPEGRLPAFMHWLCLFTAKSVNVLRGRSEALWAPGENNPVELSSADDILRYIVYTLTNPVRAGLVEDSSSWPGLRLGPQPLPTPTIAKRPSLFFRRNGKTLEQVALTIERPPAFAHLSDAEWAALVSEAVRQKENELRLERAAEGRRFSGVKQVLATSPFAKPATQAIVRKLRPLFAGPREWIKEATRRLREFRAEYRQALLRFRAGLRDTFFPAGTYALRVYYGVNCHPSGPPRLLDGASGVPGHCPT